MTGVEISAADAAEKLKKYSSWVILCHENPDGDTLGCAFALGSLGKRTGKKTVVVSKDALPERYGFLSGECSFAVTNSILSELVRDSIVVAVDISTEERSVANLRDIITAAADSLNIDHHAGNTCFAASNLVVPSASAAAEVVARIFELYGSGISKYEADALYTALTTDNGNFAFSSVTAESHRCAQVLLNAGAGPAAIYDRINENMSCGALRAWGLALSRTVTFANGKCAIFHLRESELKELNTPVSMLDGLVNLLLRIIGVKIAMFVTELGGSVKLSVRSRLPYSSRAIAEKFGGGGHICAAAAKFSSDFDGAVKKIMTEAEAYVNIRNIADK
ncbi:MAG: DHH family phosphoesterase [Synergistes sp.]|nr:DHH family phosphoesterase [Synergistes sp.]